MPGASSQPDPGRIFFEGGTPQTTTNTDVSAKSARATTINPAEDTLVMICAGQSLATNNITDTFSPANPTKIDNFAWYDGGNWAAVEPLVGCAGALHNFNMRIADGIISNGKFDRVIIAPVALAGTDIASWVSSGYSEGFYRMIVAAAKKLAARGVTPSTPGVKFLLKWNQGESDTLVATSQAAYTSHFNTLMSLCAVDLPAVKWMVAKETWITGATSAAVQAAQVALVNGTTVFAGEDMDSIGSGDRLGDDTHLNFAGGISAAAMGVTAITAITF